MPDKVKMGETKIVEGPVPGTRVVLTKVKDLTKKEQDQLRRIRRERQKIRKRMMRLEDELDTFWKDMYDKYDQLSRDKQYEVSVDSGELFEAEPQRIMTNN